MVNTLVLGAQQQQQPSQQQGQQQQPQCTVRKTTIFQSKRSGPMVTYLRGGVARLLPQQGGFGFSEFWRSSLIVRMLYHMGMESTTLYYTKCFHYGMALMELVSYSAII
jgi:hypothetical protein